MFLGSMALGGVGTSVYFYEPEKQWNRILISHIHILSLQES
jgi:hypothetical protein